MGNRSRLSRAGIALAVLGSMIAGCGGPLPASSTAVREPAPTEVAAGVVPGATASQTPMTTIAAPAATSESSTAPAPEVTPVAGSLGAGPSRPPGDAEAALLHGMRLDLQGTCAPLRDGLPARAAGAVACVPAKGPAARVTVVVFDTRVDLMEAYRDRLDVEGIPPMTNGGRCEADRPSEGGYVPGDGHGIVVDERGGCWLDADGVAHYVATAPPFTLLLVDGQPGVAMADVERFAWLGNQDQPGGPTLWAEEPRSPEK